MRPGGAFGTLFALFKWPHAFRYTYVYTSVAFKVVATVLFLNLEERVWGFKFQVLSPSSGRERSRVLFVSSHLCDGLVKVEIGLRVNELLESFDF